MTDGQELVYYISLDGLIKIGYTARFVKRMRTLAPDALLAIEPGDRRLEARRHRQFVGCRAGAREWFAPEPELLEHIKSVAVAHGVPQLPVMPVPRKGRGDLDGWGGIPGKWLA